MYNDADVQKYLQVANNNQEMKKMNDATTNDKDKEFENMGLGDAFSDETKGNAEGNSPEVAKVKRGRKPGLSKRAEKPALTPKDKFMKKLLRKAGATVLPELGTLLVGKTGVMVKIKDIGIFIKTCKDEVLHAFSKECSIPNRCNLSAEVMSKQALAVGAKIIADGRLVEPILVGKILEDGALECISGRHRLTFFGLAYGPDAEIPVIIEAMTLNQARNAVVRANESRPTKAMERAEHAVLSAVDGDAFIKQDDLYDKVVKSKMDVGAYCVFSVIDRKHPCKLDVSTESRSAGGMTTVANVAAFWIAALTWDKTTTRKVFDADLKVATEFLNALAEAMTKVKGFDPKQHLACKPLSAIGTYFIGHRETATTHVVKIAKAVVGLGEIGRNKSKATHAALCKALE